MRIKVNRFSFAQEDIQVTEGKNQPTLAIGNEYFAAQSLYFRREIAPMSHIGTEVGRVGRR